VPDDEDTPAVPPRQPIAHQVEAHFKGESNVSADLRQRRKMPRTVMTWGWVDEPQPFSVGGRPSSEHLVWPEAQRRLAAGEVPEELLLKEFGTALSNWLAENHPNAPPMSAGRAERCVRDLWHAAGRGR
jgi:hypothetical protein